MKKIYLTLIALVLLCGAKAQEASYYVGAGPDTAYLVIDFQDGTEDSSSVWGYLFDASSSVTGEDLLGDVASAENHLDVAISGGFLNDITFNGHAGIAGTGGFYWGTWSKNGGSAWSSNTGIGEVLANGDWFGCSYTDFSPAIEPGISSHAYASAWFNPNEVSYWVGSGNDSAYLIVDFVDATYGEAVTFVWGVAFDGSTTGENMLNEIGNYDENVTVDMAGGFLNDIVYGPHEGIAGTPNYWGTFSGDNLSDWTFNSGISEVVNHGDLFGVSYASWPPRRPIAPVNPVNPNAFRMSDVEAWIGSGMDSAVIVIDFNDGASVQSYAYGYLFNTNVTAETALTDLATSDVNLSVALGGGFLNDITLSSQSGIGGTNGFYWSTWSGTNGGNFEMNAGITEVLSNGDWFGCSFTDWAPAIAPGEAQAVGPLVSIDELFEANLNVYPNPAKDVLFVNGINGRETMVIIDITGRVVMQTQTSFGSINIEELPAGVYELVITSSSNVKSAKFVKQ